MNTTIVIRWFFSQGIKGTWKEGEEKKSVYAGLLQSSRNDQPVEEKNSVSLKTFKTTIQQNQHLEHIFNQHFKCKVNEGIDGWIAGWWMTAEEVEDVWMSLLIRGWWETGQNLDGMSRRSSNYRLSGILQWCKSVCVCLCVLCCCSTVLQRLLVLWRVPASYKWRKWECFSHWTSWGHMGVFYPYCRSLCVSQSGGVSIKHDGFQWSGDLISPDLSDLHIPAAFTAHFCKESNPDSWICFSANTTAFFFFNIIVIIVTFYLRQYGKYIYIHYVSMY